MVYYENTRFRLTQKCTGTNKNVERTLCASEGDTCEVLSSLYHELRSCIQTINVSAISERKIVLIFDGFPLHLHINLLKYLKGDGMVVLLHMMNTSHNTYVEDMVAFGISNAEFLNAKQSLMTEHLVLGNINGLKREEFTCLLKKSLEKACTTFLNGSGWAQSGVYPFDRNPVCRVHKADIVAADAALSTAEPLTFTTKLSAPLTEMNANNVYSLTTALATELSRTHRHA